MTGMSVLEDRYRRVLRVLPAAYRATWEEEMVATFLASMATDDPDEAEYLDDYGRPSWSEVGSVLALALRLRLGAAGAPPRSVAWGQAIRLVTLMWLLGQAVLGVADLGLRLWLTGKLSWLPDPPVGWGAATDIWHVAGNLAGLIWVLAFVGLLLGHRRIAQVLAALATVPTLVITANAVADRISGAHPEVLSLLTIALIDVLSVVAMVAFQPGTPLLPPRPWYTALGLGAVVVPFLIVVPVLDWPGLWAIVVVLMGAVHLAGPALGRGDRSPAWSHALAILAGMVFTLRVVTLVDYLMTDSRVWPPFGLVVLAVVEAIGVGAVAVPLTVLTYRTLRATPATMVG
jgi:hypothetical protein